MYHQQYGYKNDNICYKLKPQNTKVWLHQMVKFGTVI